MQLLQSSFLQALAYGLVASLWQMAFLWLTVFGVLKIFKLSAAQKFNIAFTAQLVGFALFIYTCRKAYTTGIEKIIVGKETGVVATVNAWAENIMPYAAIVYLLVLAYKFISLLLDFNNTLGLKNHNLVKMPAEQRLFVQHVSSLFSIKKKVKIFLSEKVVCPLTTGFFKPVILIPVAAINQLTTQQIEAVILHELAHIKRADYLLFIMQSIIEKIFFFNVFTLMMGEIIEKERENACDDWVLQFRYNSMHYAEALFKLGRMKAMPALAMPLQGKKESLLLMRVKRLLHKPQQNSFSLQPVLFGLLSLLVCSGLMLSSPAKKPKEFAGVNINSVNIARQASAVQPVNTEDEVAVAMKTEKKAKLIAKQETIAKKQTVKPVEQLNNDFAKINNDYERANQDYIRAVNQALQDSLQQLNQYTQAVAAKVQLNEALVQKAISYQNFKKLEAMLSATGDSIKIKESKATINSYKKLLTIESFDKDGNKHVYTVEVELYQ